MWPNSFELSLPLKELLCPGSRCRVPDSSHTQRSLRTRQPPELDLAPEPRQIEPLELDRPGDLDN